uniref:Uncharacterized protein n=1 Tax=Rhizophora mucronata TaxID=61149 RepID=A0A2P2NXT1_RHIMU
MTVMIQLLVSFTFSKAGSMLIVVYVVCCFSMQLSCK